MFWDKKGEDFAEIMRYGERVIYSIGFNNGGMQSLGFHCADGAAASAMVEQLRSGQPKAMQPSDPWYLAGKGAIVRTLYTREGKSCLEAVVDGCWEWDQEREYLSQAEGVAAYEQYELESIRDHGAFYCTVEWMDRIKNPSDRSIAEWLAFSVKYAKRTNSWLVELPARWHRYLTEAGFAAKLPEPFTAEVGAPASEADIATLAAACPQPLPEELVAIWRRHGTARWQMGGDGGILLSPTAVLARREQTRSAYAALKPGDADHAALAGSIDVLITGLTGDPSCLLTHDPKQEERFSCYQADADDLNWSGLDDLIVDAFLNDFPGKVIEGLPESRTLKYGSRAS